MAKELEQFSDCVSRSMAGETLGPPAPAAMVRESKASSCLTAADALALSRRIEKIESDIHKIENVLEKVVALLERIVPDRSKV